MLCNSLGTKLHMWEPRRWRDAGVPRGALRPPRPRQVNAPPAPYTMERLGRDALAVADALGIEKVNWCGLSMGGMVGQWMGANARDRFEKLVLSNTPYYYAEPTMAGPHRSP